MMFGDTLDSSTRPGWRWAAATVALLLVVSACNRGGDEATTTTVAPAPSTTAAVADDSDLDAGEDEVAAEEEAAEASDSGGGATTTSAAPAGEDGGGGVEVIIPPYQVVSEGEPLVAVVQPGLYSPVALENLVYDIVENYSPSAAVVVDDAAAAELAMSEEDLDEVQQSQLRARTLLRIESGVQVTFYGPYADLPGITVGS